MKRWMIAICALMLCVGCLALSNRPEPAASAPASSESEASQTSSAAPSSSSDAAMPQQQTVKAEGPVLVTSLGQGTDSIMVREMLIDLGTQFDFYMTARPEDISKYNTVILALGASSKALASGGIDPKLEYQRCAELLESLSPECTAVLVRLSDAQNQAPLTEKLLPLALPQADVILAIENGLSDTVTKYARQNSVPLLSCNKIKDITNLFGELLSPA